MMSTGGVKEQKSYDYTKREPDEFKNPMNAPGRGLSEYQFPESGHRFASRKQANTWLTMIQITRSNFVPTSGTAVKRGVKRDSTRGGYYPKYECSKPGCGGYMKVQFVKGSRVPGVVTDSAPCTCPMLKHVAATTTWYKSREVACGDLLLYINEVKRSFITNMANVGFDGSRNNGGKSHCMFLLSDSMIYHLVLEEDKKTGLGFRLFCVIICVIEHRPTNSPDGMGSPKAAKTVIGGSAKPVECGLCSSSDADQHFYELCCENMQKCNHPICTQCFTQLYRSRQFAPIEQEKFDFATKDFVFVNNTVAKCPHCKTAVAEFLPYKSTDRNRIALPIPHGWIGNRAFMDRRSFEQAEVVFTHDIQPYVSEYERAVAEHVKIKKVFIGHCQEDILRGSLHVLEEYATHCANKMYYKVDWISSDKPVPETPNNTNPVNPRDSFRESYPDSSTGRQYASALGKALPIL